MILYFLFLTNVGSFLGADPIQNAENLSEYFAGTLAGYPLDYVTELPDDIETHITSPQQITIYPGSTYIIGNDTNWVISFEPGVNYQDYKSGLFIAADGDLSIKGVNIIGCYDYLSNTADTAKAICTWYGGALGASGWGDGRLNLEKCTIQGFAYGIFGRMGNAPGNGNISINNSTIEAYVCAAMYHDGLHTGHVLSAFDSTFYTVPLSNGHGEGIYAHRGIDILADGCTFRTRPMLPGVTEQKYAIQQFGTNEMRCRFIRISNCKFEHTGKGGVMVYAKDPPLAGTEISKCDFTGDLNAGVFFRGPATVTNCTFVCDNGIKGYNAPNGQPGQIKVTGSTFATSSAIADLAGDGYEYEFSDCVFDVSIINNPNSGMFFGTADGLTLINCDLIGGQSANVRGAVYGQFPVLILGGSYDIKSSYGQYGFNTLSLGGHIEDATIYHTGGAGLTDPAGTWTLVNITY